ncbi:MAG: aminotransferase class V-fold PLP-dependent enzyme [Anaerolineae bacterium]|nr:aminotransferase class V-fold PLP-dependent enzyme [Thermoflexales bacterium]MDW8408906.1 aminotransferase class V-fold PLP-dependent enzyme [Anaerolineae bacterium]
MSSLRDLYLVDPTFTLFNNGSLGTVPRPVLDALFALECEMEFHPGKFFGMLRGRMDEVRAQVAEYLGTTSGNLSFVVNATTALNFPIRSLQLGPGDEVLSTDHEYGALNNAWRYMAKQRGFTYINHPIRVPMTTREAFVENLWEGVTPRTKVIFLSHITSPTALIWPVELVCARARREGILTIVDGAHAPGQIPLKLDEIGADFYVGNLHKWACAPKGTAILYARPEVQHVIEPLVIGWPWRDEPADAKHYIDYVEGMGTRDLCGFLAVPAALKFMREHHWEEVRAECHALAAQAQRRLCEMSGRLPLHPIEDDSWFSQMCLAPLPDDADIGQLSSRLYECHRIETAMPNWNGYKSIRISVQAYLGQADIDRLIDAIRQAIVAGC